MGGEANRVGLYFKSEQKEGVVDPSKTFKQVRYTGSPSLGQSITSIVSEELRDDRQVSDLSNTGKEVNGSINIELSVSTHDEMISGALFNEWERRQYISSDIDSIANNTITFNSVNHGLFVGALVLFSGNEATNGIHEVSAVASEEVSFDGVSATSLPPTIKLQVVGATFPQDALTLDESAKTLTQDADKGFVVKAGEWIGYVKGSTKLFLRITEKEGLVYKYDQSFATDILSDAADQEVKLVFGDHIQNGVKRKSFSFLQRFEDHDPVTQGLITGCSINNWNLEFQAQDLVRSSFDVIGLDFVFSDDAFQTEDTPLSKILNTGIDVPSVLVKGQITEGPNFIQSVSLTIANNLRQRTAVGVVGTASVAAGTCDITGSMEIYFGNKEIAQQIANNEETSYMATFYDREDKALMLLDLPRVKFVSGVAAPESKDTDVILNPEFRAILHEAFGYQINVQTFFAI